MHPAEETLLKQVTPPGVPEPPTASRSAQAVSVQSPVNTERVTRWQRLVGAARESPWLPVATKGVSIVGFMLGFAAIGAGSTLMRSPGVHMASQATPESPVAWLAPVPPVSGGTPSESSKAPAPGERPGVAPAGTRPRCSEGSLCDKPQDEHPEGLTADGKVILNVASAEVLTRLPGVGTRRAEAIVRLRQRLKRFRRPSDLLRVRGIGVKSLQRMLPHLVLDPPKPPPAPEPPTGPPPPRDLP